MRMPANACRIADSIIEICVLVTLFTLPFSKSAIEIFVTLAITVFFAKKILIEKNFRVNVPAGVLIALALFFLCCLISIVNSGYLYLSFRALVSKAIKWILLFIVVADTFRTEARMRRVLAVMIFSSVLILADGIYQQYVSGMDFLHYPNNYPVFKFHDKPQGATTFPTASFPFPNDFAAWINIYLFVFLSLFLFGLAGSKRLKIIIAPPLGLLVFFLYLTTARSAIFGAVISAGILIFANIRRFVVPVIILIIILSVAIVAIPYLRTYFTDSLDLRLSLSDRAGMWSVGWRIFKQHPIIGNGLNTFFENFRQMRTDADKGMGSYAHNCYLQMAADIGILGLGSFLAFLGLVILPNLRSAIRRPDSFMNAFSLGLCLGAVAFLVHSFFDTNLYSLNLACLFWCVLGLIQGIAGRDISGG
ncbi:MAG: O-antigen ligase family protein [Candidatus Omnitrophota bacterium]